MGKSASHLLISASYWIGFFCWLVFICYLSSKPGNELHNPLLDIPLGDKIAHVAAFATGGCLLALALHASTSCSRAKLIVWCVVTIGVFGVIDEWHQLHVPFRSGGDPFDWLADVTGATLGAIIALPFHAKIRHFTGR